MTPRRYTEKESAEIMRKAAESQAASASSTGHGVTEAELRSAAKELGIEPSAMDAARIVELTKIGVDDHFHVQPVSPVRARKRGCHADQDTPVGDADLTRDNPADPAQQAKQQRSSKPHAAPLPVCTSPTVTY